MFDEDFVMNIFRDIAEDILPFQEYLENYFDEKESNVVGSSKPVD